MAGRQPVEAFTFGTHNLLDAEGTPTPFAQVIVFTEFPIRPTTRRLWARAILKAHGYLLVSDYRQPDLVIAAKRRHWKRLGKTYTHVIDGRPKVTPNRGTLVALLEQRSTGAHVAVVGEHRINAWYPPFKRGEPEFRAEAWHRHDDVTNELINRLEDSGYRVAAGGDTNTPRDYQAYARTKLREVGHSLDRLASRRISAAEYLTRKGSDHPRVRATVKP